MTHTLVASVAIPAPTDGIVKVTWSLEGVFLQESSIGFEDLPNGSLQTYLVQFATTHLMNNRACHGTAIKYDSTSYNGVEHTSGIMVWELDFDSYTPTGTIFDAIIEHFTPTEYLKRTELAAETAVSIITSAGYAQPESPDDLGEDIQNSVQTYLMAAMMRSENISRTLFAAINDHIRLIDGGFRLPNGDDDENVLVCVCGEVFDTIDTARAHGHTEDETPDPSMEFEFRICTRAEAM